MCVFSDFIRKRITKFNIYDMRINEKVRNGYDHII